MYNSFTSKMIKVKVLNSSFIDIYTVISSLAESMMRRLILSSCLYSKQEATASSQLSYFCLKTGNRVNS